MEPGFAASEIDTSTPHPARMYDALLGGKDNYAADRAAADAALEAWPELGFAARANRTFLSRMVRYLAGEAGIRQFLDLGTPAPSSPRPRECWISPSRWRSRCSRSST